MHYDPTRSVAPLALTACLTLTAFGAAEEPRPGAKAEATIVAAPVRTVSLFKNGLAVVRRGVAVSAAGTYELTDVPDAVHGTLWVDAAGPVDVLATEREVEVPTDGRWEHDPAAVLGGRMVSARLRGEPLTEVQGTVVAFESAAAEARWSRVYEAGRHWSHWSVDHALVPAPQPNRFLVLDTEAGRVFIELASIVFLRVIDPPTTRRELRPVLRLDARGGADVSLSYLAKGLSFAPSYRLDIADPKTLTLSQTAVIRNELEDLIGVEFELISGFPSMEYSHVLSPLSATTSWAKFFEQLSQQFDGARGNRMAIGQNVLSNSYAPNGGGSAAIQPSSEGVDLHYRSLGVRDLREGESLHVHVATATAPYERIVDWRIRDTRNEWGQLVQRQSWEPDSDAQDDGAWDALRFANPFDFPMTTAPATIVHGGRFQGQRTTSWVNPGETTTVRITKALAVRSTSVEYEVEGARETRVIGGRAYRSVGVRGEVQLCNHRKEPVKMVIKREFSGDLTGTSGSETAPESRLLERGVYSANKRQELVWTLTLAPGEDRKLEYTYDVLVLQ